MTGRRPPGQLKGGPGACRPARVRIARAAPPPTPPRARPRRQVFATSKDGTRVPMFVTHRKGLDLDGSNPTLLYGYGAGSVCGGGKACAGRARPAFGVSRRAGGAAAQARRSPPPPPPTSTHTTPPTPHAPGGFNISLEPAFSPSRLAWLKAYGGVYVQVGGGGRPGGRGRRGGACVHARGEVPARTPGAGGRRT